MNVIWESAMYLDIELWMLRMIIIRCMLTPTT